MSEAIVLRRPGAQDQPIVRVAGNVLDAFKDYQALQKGLDEAMPDALMTIQGRKFRKKAYWRAVARAFNLSVEQVSESVIGDATDTTAFKWGYSAVYRAMAPNGAHADGDGTCMAREKYSERSRSWAQATPHNVRSHAHTRAFNRAVSNLVGFGEVSAEEVEHETAPAAPQAARSEGVDDTRPTQEESPQRPPAASGGHSGDERLITDKQRKRLYAIAMNKGTMLGFSKDDTHGLLDGLLESYGYLRTTDVQAKDYEAIVSAVEAWKA